MKFAPTGMLSLSPKWLLAIDSHGARRQFRIQYRWDGSRRLVEAPVPSRTPCYCILDSGAPFRRKLQRLPETERGRLSLLRAASDEFALPAEELAYGLGLRDGDAYLYALPRKMLEQLQGEGLDPAVVLFANDPESEIDCVAAIEQYESLGRSLALDTGRRRFVSRKLLRQVLLGIGLGISFSLILVAVAMPGLFGRVIDWRADELRRQAGDLPTILRATESMVVTQADAGRLLQSPESRLPEILSQVFASVPARHGIRRIEFDGKEIVVAGTGTDVKEWLGKVGFDSSQISVESVGTYQRFRATRPLVVAP